jgi:chromosome segregation ATPase
LELAGELEELRLELDRARAARNEQLEQEIADLQARLAQAEAAAAEPGQEVDELRLALEQARQTIEQRAAEIERLSQELEQVQSHAQEAAAEKELARLREELDEAESTRDDALQDLEEVRAAMNAAESAADEKELELSELRRQLAEAEAERARLAGSESELSAVRERESHLQTTLDEIRDELAQTLSRMKAEEAARREAIASLKAAEDARDRALGERDELSARLAEMESAPVDVSRFEEELLKGFELGSDLVSAQLEYLNAEERKNELVKEMEQAVNLEALNALVEQLREADGALSERQSEFEALERKWNAFHGQLDDTSQLLLLKFTGLIEYEMREARAASEKAEALALELESARASFQKKFQSLEKQLDEKDLVNGELEEELSQLANQVAELSEQLARAENEDDDEAAWKGFEEMRRELREKSELLALYRQEHETDPDRHSLEEQLQSLKERYEEGRRRIAELMELVSERDQRLAEMEESIRGGGGVFHGTLLSGSKLLSDLGLETPKPDDEGLQNLGAELSRSRASLQEKRACFERLEQEQKADEAALAAKRVAIDTAGNNPALRERLELEIVLLINKLAGREEALRRLSEHFEEEVGQRTAEDMPAVGQNRPVQMSEPSQDSQSG